MPMTNDELGDRIGVSHAMASRLRNGKRLPSVRVMNAISREFGVPVSELHTSHMAGAGEFGRLLRRVLEENRRTTQAVAPPGPITSDVTGATRPDQRGDRRARRRGL